jgi:opacity protein-like surface antigen
MGMRLIFALLLCTTAVFAGPFSIGVRGGLPLNDAVQNAQNNPASFSSEDQRYLVGPTIELHLPLRFSVQLDALYGNFTYRSVAGSQAGQTVANAITSSDQWQFPLQLKYRFSGEFLRPFVNTGASFRHLYNLNQVPQFITGPSSGQTNYGSNTKAGFVIGGGVEFKLGPIKISPEIRYTRWGADTFRQGIGGVFDLSSNEGQFLVGVTF